MAWRDQDPAALQWDGRVRGHHEAFTVALTLPQRERGFWFRYAVDVPQSEAANASVWAASFAARQRDHTFALKHAVDLKQLTTYSGGLDLRIGQQELRATRSRGGLRTESPDRELRWNLAWRRIHGAMDHLPNAAMYEGDWPPMKIATPAAAIAADGVVVVNGEEIEVRGARGTIAHTWGQVLPAAWVWGHCSAFREDPAASVEAFSVVSETGGRPATVVHFMDEDRHLAFNTRLNMHRTPSDVSERGVWTFNAKRGGWRVEGRFSAPLDRMVGVGLNGPRGEVRTCHHSDIADAVIHLHRRTIGGWKLERSYTTRAGASFELVRPKPLNGVPIFVP